MLNTPIYGESHWLSDVKLSFRYLAGYTPRAGEKKQVRVHAARDLGLRLGLVIGFKASLGFWFEVGLGDWV